jgi:hypothetical protein
VHRLEPLGLLLVILVWDGADEVMPSAALIDLARVPLEDDLVHQHLSQSTPINSRQILPRQRWVRQLRHGRFAGKTFVLPVELIKGCVHLLRDLPERLGIDLPSQLHPEGVFLLPLEFCDVSADLGDAFQPIII